MAKNRQREPEPEDETSEVFTFPDVSAAAEGDRAVLQARLDELERENERLRAKPLEAPPVPPQKVGDPSLPLWQVALQCPTPLAFKVLRVHAVSGEEAKREYCRLNGIGPVSRNPWQINQVG